MNNIETYNETGNKNNKNISLLHFSRNNQYFI